MKLRKLKYTDAPLMLSWMKDSSVVSHLDTNFDSKSIEDCEKFILDAQTMEKNAHYAIVSDNDTYMGTVSLKNIDKKKRTAEFAIVIRSEAMGLGYAWFAMETIIEKAFSTYKLESVYWCVSKENKRAIRFYEKHNFHEVKDVPNEVLSRYNYSSDLIWYSVLNGDILNEKDSVAGCRVVHINTVSTCDSGELSFVESNVDIGFEIKRIYYISKVPEGAKRGFHAHKKLKQLIFCPYGRIQLILENSSGREEIELRDPSIGVIIDKPTWREMLWLQKDSVLCVIASEYYNEDDYIRDYEEFKKQYTS